MQVLSALIQCLPNDFLSTILEKLSVFLKYAFIILTDNNDMRINRVAFNSRRSLSLDALVVCFRNMHVLCQRTFKLSQRQQQQLKVNTFMQLKTFFNGGEGACSGYTAI